MVAVFVAGDERRVRRIDIDHVVECCPVFGECDIHGVARVDPLAERIDSAIDFVSDERPFVPVIDTGVIDCGRVVLVDSESDFVVLGFVFLQRETQLVRSRRERAFLPNLFGVDGEPGITRFDGDAAVPDTDAIQRDAFGIGAASDQDEVRGRIYGIFGGRAGEVARKRLFTDNLVNLVIENAVCRKILIEQACFGLQVDGSSHHEVRGGNMAFGIENMERIVCAFDKM